jgi:hypothetical protein
MIVVDVMMECVCPKSVSVLKKGEEERGRSQRGQRGKRETLLKRGEREEKRAEPCVFLPVPTSFFTLPSPHHTQPHDPPFS